MKTMPVLLLTMALAALPAQAAGNTSFHVAQRSFSEDDIDDIELQAFDDHTAFGVSVDFTIESLPIDLAGGIFYSSRDETDDFFGLDTDVSYLELSFGVRRTWAGGNGPRSFVGGGIARVESDVEFRSGSFDLDGDDEDFGIYGEGGLYWRLGSAFNLGWSVRALLGTSLQFEGEDYPSDYVQAGLLAGWGWGN